MAHGKIGMDCKRRQRQAGSPKSLWPKDLWALVVKIPKPMFQPTEEHDPEMDTSDSDTLGLAHLNVHWSVFPEVCSPCFEEVRERECGDMLVALLITPCYKARYRYPFPRDACRVTHSPKENHAAHGQEHQSAPRPVSPARSDGFNMVPRGNWCRQCLSSPSFTNRPRLHPLYVRLS